VIKTTAREINRQEPGCDLWDEPPQIKRVCNACWVLSEPYIKEGKYIRLCWLCYVTGRGDYLFFPPAKREQKSQ
jgi:hypothetical protein